MAAESTTTLLTADDLLAMPDDGYRYEIVRGNLIQLPMLDFESSDISAGITTALRVFARTNKLGGVAGANGAFILARDPYTVRLPNASFVHIDRLPPASQRRQFLELAPDLAVEVVSPSDSANAVHEKVLEYLEAGVQLVWVVHPIQRTVTVYSPDRNAQVLGASDTLTGGEVLPDFTMPVADIFE